MVFTKNHGKKVMIAKGVRRPKSRKRGSLEVFNNIKFSAQTSSGFDYIQEVEVLSSYAEIRKNLKKLALSYYVAEAVGKSTEENEVNENIYDLLASILKQISENTNLIAIKNDFIYDLLVSLGFWPKGKKLNDLEGFINTVLEKKISSQRVGKKLFV